MNERKEVPKRNWRAFVWADPPGRLHLVGWSRPGGSAQTKARQFRFGTSFRSFTYHVLLFQDDGPKAYRFSLYYHVVNVLSL